MTYLQVECSYRRVQDEEEIRRRSSARMTNLQGEYSHRQAEEEEEFQRRSSAGSQRPSWKVRTAKEGDNKGRVFFCCPRPAGAPTDKVGRGAG